MGPDFTAVFDVAQLTSGPRQVDAEARNSEGMYGPTEWVEIPLYIEPPPSISSVTAEVVSANAGADDQYVVSTSTSGSVGSATHALHIELYRDGSLQHTEPAHDPTSGAFIHLETAAAPDALYHARVRLYQLSDDAVLSEVNTIPKARS